MSMTNGDGQATATVPASRLVDLIVTDGGDDDVFETKPQGDWLGAFTHGGLTAASALWSATATVSEELAVHSLHATFVGVGRSAEAMQVSVTRMRDGKSFATRTVEVRQGERMVMHLLCSYHRPEPGPEYQLAIDPAVPAPERLTASDHDLMVRLKQQRDVEFRDVGPTRARADGTFRSTRRTWVRVDAPLPDDPIVHACIFTVVSDVGTVMAARHPIMRGVGFQSVGAASLEHSMWFHRPIRADEWSIYELQTVSAQNARSLVRGAIHSRSGELGVTLVQEVLIRPPGSAHPQGR
jgi:acyl-CoA thioesterase-2